MDYFIDRQINLGMIYRAHPGDSHSIRLILIGLGLSFADANQFSLFACYGFHGPSGKQTLNMHQKWRLCILDDYQPSRRKDPPAWNRTS